MVRYNKVDFGQDKLNSVSARTISETGGVIEIRIDAADGKLLAEVNVAKNSNWNMAEAKLSESPTGVHDLFVILKDDKNVEIDWVKFE